MSKKKTNSQQVREYPYIHYMVEWLVPAENSVDGRAYWDAVFFNEHKAKTQDFEEAKALFWTGKKTHKKGTLRLVKVTCKVLDE